MYGSSVEKNILNECAASVYETELPILVHGARCVRFSLEPMVRDGRNDLVLVRLQGCDICAKYELNVCFFRNGYPWVKNLFWGWLAFEFGVLEGAFPSIALRVFDEWGESVQLLSREFCARKERRRHELVQHFELSCAQSAIVVVEWALGVFASSFHFGIARLLFPLCSFLHLDGVQFVRVRSNSALIGIVGIIKAIVVNIVWVIAEDDGAVV